MSSFCAICTAESAPLKRIQLDKSGPLVSVCTACDEEPAREVNGPDRGYEPTGGLLSLREMKPAYYARVPRAARSNHRTNARVLTPGFVLERVPIRNSKGVARDASEAARVAFAGCSWAADVRHLGSERSFHLFERPDVDALAKVRQGDEDPLAAIRKFEVEP